MIKRFARIGTVALTSALVIAAGSSHVLAASAAHKPAWQLVRVLGTNVNNLDPTGGSSITSALAVTGPANAWSLWDTCNWPCSGATTPVVEHWNGHRWGAVPHRELAGMTAPVAVTASSSNDAWLFSFYQKGPAYALHWNGASWTRRSVPAWVVRFNLSGEVDVQVADFGHGNVWVFSLGENTFKKVVPFAAHLVRGHWRKAYLPAIPGDVDAESAGNIWAVGSSANLNGKLVLMHWNGSKWRTQPLPTRWAGAPAGGLLGTSAHDLWLNWYHGQADSLLHWTGGRWSRVTLPAGFAGYPLVSDGRGGLWLAGIGPKPKFRRPFLHYYQGHWTLWRLPTTTGLQSNSVEEMALIPGTTSVWAIGHGYEWVKSQKTSLNRGTIWRFNP